MGDKLFKRGYSASREEKERQDRNRERSKNRLWRFFLTGDGAEADLRFLTEEPVNFFEHTVKTGNGFENYTCTGNDCSLCDDGDKATYKGAYLVVDKREYEYKDKDGNKKTGKNTVRLFVQGMKVVSQLDRISSKYGLSNRDVTIVRLGTGTQTTYTIERGEEDKLTEKEIRDLLPDFLKERYDGTMDSLMDIVEEQLRMSTKDYEDAEDEEPPFIEDSDKIIGVNDEPKKSPKRVFKKPQDSVKPRAKNLFRE